MGDKRDILTDTWKHVSPEWDTLRGLYLVEQENHTNLVAEPETPTALRDDSDAPHIWVQRFCDLVGQDGLTENSRNEAFAKLYDAVKAAKRVSNE